MKDMFKNHHLVYSLADAGIGRFYSILEYKSNWKHINLVGISSGRMLQDLLRLRKAQSLVNTQKLIKQKSSVVSRILPGFSRKRIKSENLPSQSAITPENLLAFTDRV